MSLTVFYYSLLCLDIVGDHRRVKLIMQVFRVNNAKEEKLALEKFKHWWHFVCCLGEHVTKYFEQV